MSGMKCWELNDDKKNKNERAVETAQGRFSVTRLITITIKTLM